MLRSKQTLRCLYRGYLGHRCALPKICSHGRQGFLPVVTSPMTCHALTGRAPCARYLHHFPPRNTAISIREYSSPWLCRIWDGCQSSCLGHSTSDGDHLLKKFKHGLSVMASRYYCTNKSQPPKDNVQSEHAEKELERHLEQEFRADLEMQAWLKDIRKDFSVEANEHSQADVGSDSSDSDSESSDTVSSGSESEGEGVHARVSTLKTTEEFPVGARTFTSDEVDAELRRYDYEEFDIIDEEEEDWEEEEEEERIPVNLESKCSGSSILKPLHFKISPYFKTTHQHDQ